MSLVTITETALGCDDYETSDHPGHTATLTLEDGAIACTADYEDRGDHLWLRWIETDPRHRHAGHATTLLDAIVSHHPDADSIFTEDFTDDGEHLRGRVHPG